MRKTLTGLVSLAVLAGTVTAAGAHTAGIEDPAAPTGASASASASTSASGDILARVLAIPGMRLIEEQPAPHHRFLILGFTQPVDHRNPDAGVFEQRFSLLHKDTGRPTVFHTSGYELMEGPVTAEPTEIVDGNQISLEHRFSPPSMPQPADWSKLTIRQAADDQHRLFTALKKIYTKKWIATGNSKGGMTATFYERFHPDDMDGVVAYVAPNDVDNDEDSAYDRFFERVGTAEQRAGLRALEREGLIRREAMERRLAADATAEGLTFTAVGSLGKAYEAVVREMSWNYWAAPPAGGRPALPDPAALTDQQLYDTLNGIVKLSVFADQNFADFAYEYQAGTELGSPTRRTPAHLKGLTRYPHQQPRTFVPREIPMTFKPKAMADVDRWVRDSARRMLFVNGAYDPWSAEPYRLGRGARDSAVLTAPGADHYAHIRDLNERDKALATAKLLRWAGVAPGAKRVAPDAPGAGQNLPR